jgi:hypothetical protein
MNSHSWDGTYLTKMPITPLFHRSLKFKNNNPITPSSLILSSLPLGRIKDYTDLSTRCDVQMRTRLLDMIGIWWG